MKQWRSKSNKSLFSRPIYKKDWPKLIEAMVEDGLIGVIEDTGIDWSISGYSLSAASVREAWSLSATQYRRFTTYIYEHDPFITLYKEQIES